MEPECPPELGALRAQVAALSRQVANLRRRTADLERRLAGQGSDEPAPESASSAPGATEGQSPAFAAAPERVLETRETMRESSAAADRPSDSSVKAEEPEEAPRTGEEIGWELRLATVWMPRVGAVLLTVGAAVGATLPQVPPSAKVLLGYLAALGIAGAGQFIRRHDERLARTTLATATALAYFVSFAGHYVAPMRVFPEPLALALMVGFIGLIVLQAERWRAEPAAMLAFALGVLASLVSAESSQAFALISLGVLAVGAGAVLVRHDWWRLTALAVAGTYLATVFLWITLPVGQARGEVIAHLGALVAYHAIFTAAFWRWGRRAVTQEIAAEEAPVRDAAPTLRLGLLPYSSGFAIINSVALVSLSLLLLWWTKVLWPDVHWLLFALAAAEASRLGSRALRRGPMASFHLLMAFATATAGVVSAFSGLTESGVLAAQALALAVAASRAPLLRPLRPLSGVCAALAIWEFRLGVAIAFPDLLMHLLPAVLLLASALPWESIWVIRPRPFAEGWLGRAEEVSGQWRGLVAAVMAIATLIAHFADPTLDRLAVTALGLLLLLGALMLSARAWLVGAAVATLGGLTALANLGEPVTGVPLLGWLGLLAAVYLGQEVGGRARSLAETVAFLVAWALLAATGLHVALWSVADIAPHRGLGLAAGAALLALMGVVQRRFPPIPSLASTIDDDPRERIRITSKPPIHWDQIELSHLVAAPIAAASLWITVAHDARTSLLSALIISLSLVGAWLSLTSRRGRNVLAEGLLAGAAVAVGALGTLHFGDGSPWSVIATLAIGGLALTAGVIRASFPAAVAGVVTLAAVALAALFADQQAQWIHGDAALGLLLGLGVIASGRLVMWARGHFAAGEERHDVDTWLDRPTLWWLAGSGAALFLLFLAEGEILAPPLITVSWAGVGIALLLAGFALRDKLLRHVSLGVFAVTLGRIFFHDLTDVPALTRAVALLGVGVLMVAAGMLYGTLRGRVVSG